MLKKVTKIRIAALAIALTAVFSATAIGATTSSIDVKIAKAQKSKTFKDYNDAYAEFVKLPANKQSSYSSKLINLAKAVPQYSLITKLLNDQVYIGKTANAADFWDNYNSIRSTVSNGVDKNYLINELSGWGLKLLNKVPGYTAATDAIIAAAGKLSANDIEGAKSAVAAAKKKIAAVAHGANKTYLLNTLEKDVEDKLPTASKEFVKSINLEYFPTLGNYVVSVAAENTASKISLNGSYMYFSAEGVFKLSTILAKGSKAVFKLYDTKGKLIQTKDYIVQ